MFDNRGKLEWNKVCLKIYFQSGNDLASRYVTDTLAISHKSAAGAVRPTAS